MIQFTSESQPELFILDFPLKFWILCGLVYVTIDLVLSAIMVINDYSRRPRR